MTRPFVTSPIRLALLPALILPAILPAASPEPPWHVPDARHRILVAAEQDLPDLWLDLSDPPSNHVVARDARGETLPIEPFHLGETLAGIAIPLPAAARSANHKSLRKSAVHIYFVDQPAAIPPVRKRTPVALFGAAELSVACPVTADEYRRMDENRPPLKRIASLPELPRPNAAGGLINDLMPPNPKKRPHHTWRYRIATACFLGAPRDVAFAATEHRSGAWFLFVDGHPVTSWCEGRSVGGRRLGPTVHLDAGYHTIDLFGLLRRHERFPQLSLADPDGGPDPDQRLPLVSPNPCRLLAASGRDDILTPGLQLTPLNRYRFRRTGALLQAFRFRNATANLFRHPLESTNLRINDHRCHVRNGAFLVPAERRYQCLLTAEDSQGYTASLPVTIAASWPRTRLIDADFRLPELPLIEPADSEWRLPYRLTTSPAAGWWLQHAVLVARLRGPDGAVIDELQQPIPASPFERVLAVTPTPDTASIEFLPVIAGRPIAPPIRIYRLTGREPDLPDVPGGDRLRYRDGYAVIRRRPATTDAAPTPPQGAIRKVALIDDFIAPEPRFGDAEPVSWEALAPVRVSHHSIDDHRLRGRLPLLAKYDALAEAIATDADAIALLTGIPDIVDGMDLRDFSAQLLYLAAACIQHGKTPILVALPPHRRLPADRLRSYALAAAEIGATLGVPVVDLYSASQLTDTDLARHHRLPDRPDIRLAAPDAEARSWCLQQLARVIRNHNAL